METWRQEDHPPLNFRIAGRKCQGNGTEKSRYAERGVSRRPPLNGWIVVVLVVVVLACHVVLAPTTVARRAIPRSQVFAPSTTEPANAFDDDYEDDDEDDSILLRSPELRERLSPRDENIDSNRK